MGFTGNLIRLALAKQLIEKMVVRGVGGRWIVFHETLNNKTNKSSIICT